MASHEDLFQQNATDAAAHDAEGAAQAPEVSDAPAGDAPAPARKRARRATKKASAPAPKAEAGATSPADSAADSTTDSAADSTTDSALVADAGPAPAKKAARKTVKKAAKKTTTKRASAKAAAAEVAPVEQDAPVAEVDEDAVDLSDEIVGVPGTEAAIDSTGDEADDDGAAGTVPSFGVLFQAPDPAAATPTRTRKRATAKAGAPEPRAAAPEPLPEADDVRGAVETSDATDQADEADQADRDDSSEGGEGGRRRRRRGGKGRGRGRGQSDDSTETGDADSAEAASSADGESDSTDSDGDAGDDSPTSRRRRRRRRSGSATEGDDPPGTVTRVRESRRDEPQSVKGSTRLEAKKQRRREGREAGRRRTIITEAEFLARRESVERVMVVREREGKTQIGVLEDDVLVEHYVSRESNVSMAGNVYLGRVQNVLPSMEAAFVDIGKGRNAVLYAGEVNWDAAGLENNQPKRIENALKSGDQVLVQVTKDPIGHKGARLTSQISLPGRYLVFVPEGSMTGISRKLPDTERSRLKGILKEVVPDSAGVIVRTAAEGASEEELRADVERLTKTWDKIKAKADSKGKGKGGAPALVHGEPDLTVRVIRDVFNEDFTKLVVAGDQAWGEVSEYLGDVAPDLAERLEKWVGTEDLFTRYRVDEQIAKAMDRKVWLPSGGSLVIDRTEAMTVVDVNTGKFVGSGGNLEETVTKNNIEAAEEIVRQLRLRDIGGIIVIDFIDMVLESNRDLVVRRLLECLGRDRTKHQVAEVTSLGLVQMTRKRVGSGLIEVFSENCEHCGGRGIIVHADPVEKSSSSDSGSRGGSSSGSSSGSGSGSDGGGQQASRGGRSRRGRGSSADSGPTQPAAPVQPAHSGPTPAQIAAAAHAAALKSSEHHDHHDEIHDEVHGDHHEHEAPAQDDPIVEVHEARDQEAVEAAPVETAPTETAPEAEPVEPAPVEAAPVEPAPVAAPATAAAAAPKRRKRARVVAPAGPPRGVADEAAAEPAGDQG